LFSDQAVKTYSGGKPNYTQPIEKEWVGLTEDEIREVGGQTVPYIWVRFVRDIEAKLKEKNT
jgi:hypothetical protein